MQAENPGQNFCKLFLKIYFGKNRASPGISTYPNISRESLEMIPDTQFGSYFHLSAAVVVVDDNNIWHFGVRFHSNFFFLFQNIRCLWTPETDCSCTFSRKCQMTFLHTNYTFSFNLLGLVNFSASKKEPKSPKKAESFL
jgi:hypothetical protein